MIEILQLDKKHAADESALRAAVGQERPDSLIEGVKDAGDNWLVRVKTAEGDVPPFMKKEEEDAPTDEAPSDEPKDDSKDDSKGGDEKPEGLGDDVKDKKGDLVGELKDLIEQATTLFTDLGGKAEELAQDAQAKDDKINEINDSIQEHVKGDDKGLGAPPEGLDAPLPGDIGPTPGKPAGPPMPPKRPGVPGGKAAPRGVPGGGIPTFTNRKTEVVRHPGVNAKGEPISILAAVAEIETDSAFADYEIAGFTTNVDGTYSAKLTLKG